MIVENTPVEEYDVNGHSVLVKREDKACAPPGPPFSKVRGLFSHLTKLKEDGVRVVGYTESSVSMAGWGVAWLAKELGLKAVIFDPRYVVTLPILAMHRAQWRKFGAEVIPLKATMVKVNWNISRRILRERYGEAAVLLPLGLPFEETIAETSNELRRTLCIESVRTVMVNVGSGTICAGILRGLDCYENKTVIGVMGRTGSIAEKQKSIVAKAKIVYNRFRKPDFRLIDPGYQYTQKETFKCPFPCHTYYDRKAWRWLVENIEEVGKPVLFWNIGR